MTHYHICVGGETGQEGLCGLIEKRSAANDEGSRHRTRRERPHAFLDFQQRGVNDDNVQLR